MKKIILSIFALGTLAANAQEVTGFSKGNISLTGAFRYGVDNITTPGTKATDFVINPSVMYMATNNWGILGGLYYGNVKTETAGTEVSSNTFGGGLGAKYLFTPANRLSFFLKGDAVVQHTENELTVFNLGFSPGMMYFLHKNWAVGASLNLFNFGVLSPKDGDATVDFDIDPRTNLGDLTFTISYVFK